MPTRTRASAHMLDFYRLLPQLAAFSAHRAAEDLSLRDRLGRAVEALHACSPEWPALRARVTRARPTWLVAQPREAPDGRRAAGPRPTPVTVAASDGSQIFPDRNVEPVCYLLNVSRVAFQYGTVEPPVLDAVPSLRFRGDERDAAADGEVAAASAEVVSAVRDELELEVLLETARAARVPGRPVLAVSDGTLIRWMLRGMHDRDLEQRMIRRYVALLDEFRRDRLPVCSYISFPRSSEVVNLLRVFLGEAERPVPPEASLAGLDDRRLFEEVLRPGERSAVFESASHIQQEYGPTHSICFVYVRVRSQRGFSEVARVEMPRWVVEEEGWLELIHAVVLDQAEKGEGYPLILSEAHEKAVVRAAEREMFYQVLARHLHAAGRQSYTESRKQRSKRTPRV